MTGAAGSPRTIINGPRVPPQIAMSNRADRTTASPRIPPPDFPPTNHRAAQGPPHRARARSPSAGRERRSAPPQTGAGAIVLADETPHRREGPNRPESHPHPIHAARPAPASVTTATIRGGQPAGRKSSRPRYREESPPDPLPRRPAEMRPFSGAFSGAPPLRRPPQNGSLNVGLAVAMPPYEARPRGEPRHMGRPDALHRHGPRPWVGPPPENLKSPRGTALPRCAAQHLAPMPGVREQRRAGRRERSPGLPLPTPRASRESRAGTLHTS